MEGGAFSMSDVEGEGSGVADFVCSIGAAIGGVASLAGFTGAGGLFCRGGVGAFRRLRCREGF